LGLDYNLSSVDAIDPFDGDRFFEEDVLDQTDLIQDRGDRRQIGGRVSLETGLNDPVGFNLSARYRELNYSGTTDPDLFDSEIYTLAGTVRFTLSPVTETRLVLRHEGYSADDAPLTERRTNSVSLGLTHALSRTDRFDVSVGYQEIETDETILGTRRTDTEDGITGSLGYVRELPRGSIGASFDLRESVNGQSASLLVNRAVLLPRGALDLSLGVTRDINDKIRPVGSLDFIHQMPRSTFTASLSQQVATSTQANELRTTEASLGYAYQINSLSDLSFTANYVAIDQIGGGAAANDATRTNLRAIYSHALTPDWWLSSGYEYRMRDETGVGKATSNRVFLTLQRDFVIRP
jgi:hypothetical protein